MNELLRRAAARIADNEFWLLWVYGAPLLFASNLPPWLFAASLGTIPIFWIARRIARGAWSVPTPLDLPLALLLLLGIVSVAVSNDLGTSLLLYGELLGGIALYYGVVNGLPPHQVSKGVWLLLAFGLGMAVLGVLGVRYAQKFPPLAPVYEWLPKVNVSLLNPSGFAANIVAGALAPIVPLALALGLAQSNRRRILLFGFALFLTLVIFLTQSRGALIGLVIALALLLGVRVPRVWWFAPLVLLVVLAGVVWLGPEQAVRQVVASDTTGSAGGRLELWDRALRMMSDFPFTGIGLGTFEPTVLKFYPLLQNTPGEPEPHAHNLYLQMGVDYGVAGLVAFLGIVTTAVAVSITALRSTRGTPYRWLVAGLFAGYLVYLIHSMFDAVTESTKAGIIVWLILGMLIVLYHPQLDTDFHR